MALTPQHWLDTQRSFQEKELAAQERHLKRSEKQLQMYADIKKKVFGMNQNEKDAEFSRQFDALTAVYNQELAAVGDNEAEKLRIKEAYMAAELALRTRSPNPPIIVYIPAGRSVIVCSARKLLAQF